MTSADLIGKVCIKTCGRESRRKCVVVDVIDEHFVLVDGNVKRRRCNIAHLEITGSSLKISKGASTEQVRKAMKDAGMELTEPRKHEASLLPKPVKQRKKAESKEQHLSRPVKEQPLPKHMINQPEKKPALRKEAKEDKKPVKAKK